MYMNTKINKKRYFISFMNTLSLYHMRVLLYASVCLIICIDLYERTFVREGSGETAGPRIT